MARTAIPVDTVGPHQKNTEITRTAGDAVNDHQIDLSNAPRLILFVKNTGANTISFSIVFPASAQEYDVAISRTVTLTNAQAKVIPLDVPHDMRQSGDLLHIDSADANFSDLRFHAYTWAPTPIQ